MSGFEYVMLPYVDVPRLLLCVCAPQKEHHSLAVLIEGCDDGVCERLPSKALMTVRLMGGHCEGGVEEEDSLLSPLP